MTPYRRHLGTCTEGKKNGRGFSLCDCPIWVYGYLPDGNPIRRSLQTTNWDRAKRRIEILQSGTDESAWFGPESVMAAPAAADLFLKNCQSRNLRQATVKDYRNTLAHFAGYFGARALSSIGMVALDGYFSARTMAPRTCRKELETLRTFLAFCVDRKWIAENPARRIRPPKIDGLATLPFAEGEVQKLLGACDAISSQNPHMTPYIRHRARALTLTLLYSGLRISDVSVLKRSALEATGHLALRVMKTGAPLKVLLHPDCVQSLIQLPSASLEYFFWSGRGTPIACTKNLGRTISRLGKIAGVHAHPHRFRDTFAVELLTKGADIRTVQHLLGHHSVQTTERHYAHFVAAHQELLDRASARLDFSQGEAGRPFAIKPLQRRSGNA